MTIQELYTAALQDANSGQYAEAIRKFELVLTHEVGAGDKANVCALLGGVYLMVGDHEQGTRRLEEALAVAPNNPAGWSNLSEGLRRLGRLNEAVEASRKALSLRPDFAEAHNNMGISLQEQGNLDDAIASYRRALSLKPDYANANYNMGNALKHQGKLDDAIASYLKTLSLKPDFAEAHNNKGIALQEQGNLHDAIASYKKALMLKPDYAEAHNNMGATFKDQGKLDDAITSYSKALTLKPDYPEAYNNMGVALKGVEFSTPAPEISDLIYKLLEKKVFVRPKDVSKAAISLLKFDSIIIGILKKHSEGKLSDSLQENIADLSDIPLLLKLMELCPIPDLTIESVIQDIRAEILLNISNINNNLKILPFQISLALQCFTNEYMYDKSNMEIKYLKKLEGLVENNLINGGQPNPNQLACLASYKALYEYSWVHLLSIPIELDSIRRKQILEPEEEKQIRLKIPVLQDITNPVSSKVRDQYEQNPFPRWVNLKLELSPKPISEITKFLNLKIPNLSINEVSTPQLLIAGCGTGQHSIGSASWFKNCDVLAIDLSLRSLAYAQRKTEELGVVNIEYMQADILDLGELNQKFDIIECAGVLHHMDEPMAGWKVLADLLNPGGLMKIGLYSELARKHVAQIRNEIKKLNIDSSDDAMRSLRKQIISSEEKHHNLISSSMDFYSMSTFRDLLFHVQEHRFTIPRIKDCLDQLGLIFCGFEDTKIVHKFKLNNLAENAVFDLEKWNDFEKENPHEFSGMYQFWCQKL